MSFEAFKSGGDFLIKVSDNGRGIDWRRLSEKAAQNGLPCSSRQDLEQALFMDGISTKDVISEISGRGVGMAAVLQATTALGGHIAIDSKPGHGTTFTFTFPSAALASKAA